jgi:hypothetical protein
VPEIEASRTPEELRLLLDELPETDDSDLSMSLGQLSALDLLDRQGTTYELLSARFFGDLPGPHEISVRAATTILGELQDALSEIGAVLLNSVPKRGPLPHDVIAKTELRLSPRVRPGSVTFGLHAPAAIPELWQDATESLLNLALDRLFRLFNQVEKPATSGGTPDTITKLLHDFGPRTARHLFRFAETLDGGGLSLDLGWTRSGQPFVGSRLSGPGAAFLRELAKAATTRVNDVTLVGQVRTLGADNKHRIKDEIRGTVTFSSSDGITDELHPAFKHGRVEVDAVEVEVVNLVTGAITRSYEATAARRI